MRYRARMVSVVVVATMLAATAGLVGGWFLGRVMALRLTQDRLVRYADRLLEENEEASTEAMAMAAQQNASPYPFCSDTEIAYFRNLVLRSRFIKDAGRIRDGKIYCSAVLGRLKEPIAVPKPDFIGALGSRMYRSIPGYPIEAFRTQTHQRGDSYEVFSHWFLRDVRFSPYHFTLTMRDKDPSLSGWLVGEKTNFSRQLLTHGGEATVGGSLLTTRCSEKYIGCVTTFVPVSVAVQAEHGQIRDVSVLGALLGAIFGLLWSMLYRRNRSMDQQLRRAIRRNKLRVVYQPIVDLTSGHIVGAESLARWNDEDGVPVSPSVFIGLAEQKGYTGEIMRLVLRHVLHDMREVIDHRPDLFVNINVTAAELTDPSFLPTLTEKCRQAGFPAANLGIEITEGSTVHHDAAIGSIRDLRKAGHTIYIDDFGTGYSSLSYLANLAANTVKIDMAFTRAIGTDAVTVGIIPQILAMAETLKMGVVVEGVETKEQMDYFKGLGKPILAQGWFFGWPHLIGEFRRMLAEDEKKPRSS